MYFPYLSTGEGLNSCDCPSNDQSMNIIRAFICVDGLEVDGMTKDMILF